MLSRVKGKGKTDQVVKLAGDQPKNWLECPIEKRRPRLIGVANESKIRHDRRATIPKRMAESGVSRADARLLLSTRQPYQGGYVLGCEPNVPAP